MKEEKTMKPTQTNGSNLLHLRVSTEAEGAILGHVTQIICSREKKAVTAIAFRENIFKEEYMIPVASIRKVGRDLLVIDRETSIRILPKTLRDNQVFLKSFTGTQIASHAGNTLGKLSDIGVDASWSFSRLFLDHYHWLDVSADEITVGHDQILVPAGSTDKIIETKPDPGWSLQKAFEKETYEQLGESIQRSFRKRRQGNGTRTPEKGESIGDG